MMCFSALEIEGRKCHLHRRYKTFEERERDPSRREERLQQLQVSNFKCDILIQIYCYVRRKNANVKPGDISYK